MMSVKDDIAQVPAILKSLRVDSEAARMLEAIPLYVLNVIHEGAIGIPTSIAHRIFNATAGIAPFGVSIPDRPSMQNLKIILTDELPLFNRSTNEPSARVEESQRSRADTPLLSGRSSVSFFDSAYQLCVRYCMCM